MKRSLLPALTVFWGSALLFGVQPMVGRTLLPFFGGTSAVWIVCLCAFQILLLGGYFYAHRLANGPNGLRPARLHGHLTLLAVSSVWAFAVAGLRYELNSFVGGLHPTLGVILFLLTIVGLPYLALSANSSLVQVLAVRGDADVYHLYAVSNAGSFVGLFLYPFVLEPFVSVGGQWQTFAIGIALYGFLLFRLARSASEAPPPRKNTASQDGVVSAALAPSTKHKAPSTVLWLLLPALSCATLNAVTAHMTLDVIAMPLLWCILLALFLLSYIIGFSPACARLLPLWDALALLSAAGLANLVNYGGSIGFAWHLLAGSGFVLFGGTALHVRLYLSRPTTDALTRYYLFGAIGGAIGGTLTGLVAPLVFTRLVEYPATLVCITLALALLRPWRCWPRQIPFAALACATFAILIWRLCENIGGPDEAIHRDRGFFGTVKVTSAKAKVGDHLGEYHQYMHGSTLHGAQFVANGYGLQPTLYYVEQGGGLAITQHPKYKRGQPLRVGIVGTGMGVSCAYGRTNDTYRCFEISPEVLKTATDPKLFTFMTASPARIEPVLGDARLVLKEEHHENAPKYDVLQIDAFSGDSVPYHLSTKEAFQLYFDRLAPGGFLSVHISNWHIDLAPMIKAVAWEFDVNAILYAHKSLSGAGDCAWGLFVKTPPADMVLPKDISIVDLNAIPNWKLPTDERGSLIDLIRLQGLFGRY